MCEHKQDRRQFLISALATGSLAALSGLAQAGGRQISDIQGSVFVNGRRANSYSSIRPGDVVKTGRNSKIVFVVGQDAIILRSNSRLILQSENRLVSGLRLLTGAMMAVFAPGKKTISTVTATAGIRGTGIYVEAKPDETYFCTCYGAVQLDEVSGTQQGELVEASHHAARYVRHGQALQEAPMINHQDLELELLESLVGRSVPF
jgi:hypothetical protein